MKQPATSITLSPSEMSTLIALKHVEPATIRLIDTTRSVSRGSNIAVLRLIERGIVERREAPAQIPRTRDEAAIGIVLRTGRAPYQYSLTSVGRTIAHHLQAIANQLREEPSA